jgi:UDP-glucose 4-epimerase
MRILVTGGAGFIGSHIVDAYLAAGHDVAVVDNFWPHGGGRREQVPAAARLYEVDIRDPRLREIVLEERPEVINHHAAQHSVKFSTDDPAHDAQVNVLGLINVLQAAQDAHVRKVLFASSAATYGTVEHLPITEQTPQRPESPYGITKMVAEHYLRYWQQERGLQYTALRYANVYGPRQDPTGEAGVVAIFTRHFLDHAPVTIYWDGEQTRDYVYVGDVARANVLALEAAANAIVCIGSGVATSVNAIYRGLAALCGYDVPIERLPRRPGDPRDSLYQPTYAAQVLGWQPEVPFAAGLGATLEWFRQRPHSVR